MFFVMFRLLSRNVIGFKKKWMFMLMLFLWVYVVKWCRFWKRLKFIVFKWLIKWKVK